MPLADVGVPVHPAALGFKTVVEVKGPQPLQADDPVEFAQGGGVCVSKAGDSAWPVRSIRQSAGRSPSAPTPTSST